MNKINCIKEKFNLHQMDESRQFCPINEDTKDDKDSLDNDLDVASLKNDAFKDKSEDKNLAKDDKSSSKKKRRKKSLIKKKNTQRKGSISSSAGSINSDQVEFEQTENSNINITNSIEAVSNDAIAKYCPTDDEFCSNIVQYSDICNNPTLFASPNLVVRINNKYYN